MDKPKLLDLFCGAGGATKGYQRAGFYVVGVDIKPQPHYCGDEFYQADALTFPLEGYDAYHASPPCQYYSRLRYLPWLKDKLYWRSVPPTLARLKLIEPKPWVVENVEDCWDLPDSYILCGRNFNLPIYRHRRFKSNIMLMIPPHQKHTGVIAAGRASIARRYSQNSSSSIGVIREISRNTIAGHIGGVKRAQFAMDIDWMNQQEITQAIPPAYTEFIGNYLMEAVRNDKL